MGQLHGLDDDELLRLHRAASSSARKAGAGRAAADVAQQAILRLLEQEVLPERERREPWVRTAAKRLAIDQHRRDEVGKRMVRREEVSGRTFTTELTTRLRVQELLRQLPDRHRSVLELTYVHGLPASEVAERLGYTTPTVHKLLSEARRLLRPQLTDPTTRPPVEVRRPC